MLPNDAGARPGADMAKWAEKYMNLRQAGAGLHQVLLTALLVSCDGLFGPDAQLAPCKDFQEFGSAGCAVVEVLVSKPENLNGRWLLKVSARWPGGGGLAHAAEPEFGSFTMRMNLLPPSPVAGGDTASVWMIGRIVDVEESIDGTTEYLARDSVLSVLYFARIGEIPELQSVRLTL